MPTVLYTLFILSAFPIVLAFIGLYFRWRQFGRVDNRHPRVQQSELRGTGARVVAAQQNAWESLVVYTVAVFIAHASGMDLRALDGVAVAFLALRTLHAVFYVADFAVTRSVVYALGMGCCVYIFILAATHAT